MTPDEIKHLIQNVTKEDGFNHADRTQFERYFIREFCTWLPLRTIAEITGIENPSTVSLQIKKLNEKPKYKFEILKLRRMLKELLNG